MDFLEYVNSLDPPPLVWDLEGFGWDEGYWVPVGLPMRDLWTSKGDLSTTSRLRGKMRNTWIANGKITFAEYEPVGVDDYLKLVPWQHKRPRFLALLRSVLLDGVEVQNFAYNMGGKFDVDTAYGEQLDQIGRWVGISRNVSVPLENVYFSWGIPGLGWDEGYWIGPDDSTHGLTKLPDDVYRNLIKAKIAANSWDGTKEGAYDVWEIAFEGKSQIVIIDNQDMSMDMIISGIEADAAFTAVVEQGLLPLKPEGVRVNYYLSDGKPVFMWDVEANQFGGGWDIGYWRSE